MPQQPASSTRELEAGHARSARSVSSRRTPPARGSAGAPERGRRRRSAAGRPRRRRPPGPALSAPPRPPSAAAASPGSRRSSRRQPSPGSSARRRRSAAPPGRTARATGAVARAARRALSIMPTDSIVRPQQPTLATRSVWPAARSRRAAPRRCAVPGARMKQSAKTIDSARRGEAPARPPGHGAERAPQPARRTRAARERAPAIAGAGRRGSTPTERHEGAGQRPAPQRVDQRRRRRRQPASVRRLATPRASERHALAGVAPRPATRPSGPPCRPPPGTRRCRPCRPRRCPARPRTRPRRAAASGTAPATTACSRLARARVVCHSSRETAAGGHMVPVCFLHRPAPKQRSTARSKPPSRRNESRGRQPDGRGSRRRSAGSRRPAVPRPCGPG